jgi:hypothetical protein
MLALNDNIPISLVNCIAAAAEDFESGATQCSSFDEKRDALKNERRYEAHLAIVNTMKNKEDVQNYANQIQVSFYLPFSLKYLIFNLYTIKHIKMCKNS